MATDDAVLAPRPSSAASYPGGGDSSDRAGEASATGGTRGAEAAKSGGVESHQQVRFASVSPRGRELLAAGESTFVEYKQNARFEVSDLVALANAVALDPAVRVAYLLLGVDEQEDAATGVTTGVAVGLGRFDTVIHQVLDRASKVLPVPADVLVVEEDVEGTPFLRVEVRPTTAPHYDARGSRVTRQGKSVRAMTDGEMLNVYLQREASSFAVRFRAAGQELAEAVGTVGGQVEAISEAIESRIASPLVELRRVAGQAAAAAGEAAEAASSASSAADTAASTADLVSSDVRFVEDIVRDLRATVASLDDLSLDAVVARVLTRRREVWWAFCVDTYERTSVRATGLEEKVRDALSAPVAVDAGTCVWEVAVWDEFLSDRKAQRGQRGTLKWWEAVVTEMVGYRGAPSWGEPELPDLRADMRADIDRAVDDPESLTRRFAALLEK